MASRSGATGARVKGGSGPEITRDALATAALAVLDRDGLDGLSMRRVAVELGVAAASLYWHVRNKEELLDLVADALFRDLNLDLPQADWRSQMYALAHLYRAYLKSRRDAVRVIGGRFISGPHSAQRMEVVLEVLRSAGFSRGDAAHAAYLIIVAYVQGFVLQEMVPMTAAEALGATPAEAMAIVADQLATLPAADYPRIAESVDLLTMLNLDDRFNFGLNRILDGLALTLTRTRTGADQGAWVGCGDQQPTTSP